MYLKPFRIAAVSLGLALSAASSMSAVAQPRDEVDPAQPVRETVVDIAGWVIATGDNRGFPFAIVDKEAAQVLVFAADGKLRGLAPALVGSAEGDHSAPGVGDRELKDIPMKDRTTPAGRFIAEYGPAAGNQTVLWVDYATAVSIHPLSTSSRTEKREERLASPKPDDNRITHGCINVSPEFYNQVVKTTFAKGGVFYVLPESMTLAEAFPGYASPSLLASLAQVAKIVTFKAAAVEPVKEPVKAPARKASK